MTTVGLSLNSKPYEYFFDLAEEEPGAWFAFSEGTLGAKRGKVMSPVTLLATEKARTNAVAGTAKLRFWESSEEKS